MHNSNQRTTFNEIILILGLSSQFARSCSVRQTRSRMWSLYTGSVWVLLTASSRVCAWIFPCELVYRREISSFARIATHLLRILLRACSCRKCCQRRCKMQSKKALLAWTKWSWAMRRRARVGSTWIWRAWMSTWARIRKSRQSTGSYAPTTLSSTPSAG